MSEQYEYMFWFYEPHEYEKYIDHLTLKAEKILFRAMGTDSGHPFWGQFIEFLESNDAVRELIAAVISDAFKQVMQKGELDFMPPNQQAAGTNAFVPLYRIELDAPFCKVYSADDRAGILFEYISFVEKLHCERLSKSRAPGYSIKDYINEAEGHHILMDELTYAFDDGIKRIDLSAYWTDERVEMVRSLYEHRAIKRKPTMRKIDELGRVAIPDGIRRQFNLEKGMVMEFSTENGHIIMTPVSGHWCRCCNKETARLYQFGNIELCENCIEEFTRLAGKKV